MNPMGANIDHAKFQKKSIFVSRQNSGIGQPRAKMINPFDLTELDKCETYY